MTKDLLDYKNDISSHIQSQYRCVTAQDYKSRILNMPPQYGNIAKAYVKGDSKSINIYALAYDQYGNFTPLNDIVQKNIKAYLEPYKIIGDVVIIDTIEIINIGIEFDLLVRNKYNAQQVRLDCLNELKILFANQKMQPNQNIMIQDIINHLYDNVVGIRLISNFKIFNIHGDSYSNYTYNIIEDQMGIITPPENVISIFEIKYPNDNINGTIKNIVK